MVACPICDGQDFEILATRDRYDMGVSTAGCKRCGLVMTNPMLAPEAMQEFYRHHYRRYYHKVEVPTFEHIHSYELDRRAAYTVDFLVKSDLLHDCRRVLDVGCGEGSILKELGIRKPHTSLVGVEPGYEFAKFAREHAGCVVYSSLAELANSGEPAFDLIVVNHVLEHVENPVSFLLSLKKILSKEGRIYLDVPDVSSYSNVTELHIAHLYHFSVGTLGVASEKAGLRPVAIERHCPPRHPRSIRAVLVIGHGQECLLPSDEASDGARVHALIRTINRRAWLSGFRNRLVGPLRRAVRQAFRK